MRRININHFTRLMLLFLLLLMDLPVRLLFFMSLLLLSRMLSLMVAGQW